MKNIVRRLKMMMTVFLLICLCSGCSAVKQAPENEGILGTWYESTGGMIEVVVFYDDGTCMRTLEEYAEDKDQDYLDYHFDASTGRLEMELYDYPAEVILEETKMTYTFAEYDETHILYRDRVMAKNNDPAYCISDEFTDTIMDKHGFCVQDGILYAYRGDAESIIVPDDVEVIYTEAFSADYNHGVNLKMVIIPGSVKEIQSQAFAFTNADVIILEEGVETLGDYVFMDSYVEEVYFPASLTEIGTAILETEEGLDGTRIYVPGGSAIEAYLQDNPPYGDTEIVVE